MPNRVCSPNIDPILEEFDRQVSWLQSLVTDPSGARYLTDKDPETRLREFQEHIPRTADFLKFADGPQEQFLSIQVAGTSGKGSVAVMIASILRECLANVGLHISPYLQTCNEKLVMDGEMIAPSEFVELVRGFRRTYESWANARRAFSSLKYGEAWVCLAYLWFAQRHADWAVVETGMGGRFDPTNVLNSELAVITNVAFDHVKALGPSLSNIAYHKAGIIDRNATVITSATDEVALRAIREEARRKRARLYCIGRDFDFTVEEINSNGGRISVKTPTRCYEHVVIGTRGVFQPINAALAISAVDILAQRHGITLSAGAVESALSKLEFPGRMEVIQDRPLVILDVAHNPHKMQALVDSMLTVYPGKDVTAIVGSLETKDSYSMMKILLRVVSSIIVTKPIVLGKPSTQTEVLADIVRDLAPALEVCTVERVEDAVCLALETLSDNELLLITGSVYLVGEARNHWIPRKQLLRNIEIKKRSSSGSPGS